MFINRKMLWLKDWIPCFPFLFHFLCTEMQDPFHFLSPCGSTSWCLRFLGNRLFQGRLLSRRYTGKQDRQKKIGNYDVAVLEASPEPMTLPGNGSAELSKLKANFPGLCTSLSASHWTQLLGESTVLDNMALFVWEQSPERDSTLNCVPVQSWVYYSQWEEWGSGFWKEDYGSSLSTTLTVLEAACSFSFLCFLFS